MTILKLKNGNRKKCHDVFSKDEDKRAQGDFSVDVPALA